VVGVQRHSTNGDRGEKDEYVPASNHGTTEARPSASRRSASTIFLALVAATCCRCWFIPYGGWKARAAICQGLAAPVMLFFFTRSKGVVRGFREIPSRGPVDIMVV